MLGWLIALLVGLIGLFFLLPGSEGAEASSLEGGEMAYLAVFGALALLYLVSLAADYRGRAGAAMRHAMVWLVLGVILIAGYGYRSELRDAAYRVAGDVMPPGVALSYETGEAGERSVRLRRHPSGHFLARASVDGTELHMLVDTGASTVVLRPADAERAGIDVDGLLFTVPVTTANGTAYAAPVRIRSIVIGNIEVNDVEALVAKPGSLKESLLGMSFLKRLRSYEFSGDFLTLRG